jgi:glutaminyl-peptide cyclotransferase
MVLSASYFHRTRVCINALIDAVSICRLLQLTWLSNTAYSYAIDNFEDVKSFRTPLKDGWGAAMDGTSLIVSDGSTKLYWVNPNTYAMEKSLEITDGTRPVKFLNEVRQCSQAVSD